MPKVIDFAHYKQFKQILHHVEQEVVDKVSYVQCKRCAGELFVLLELDNRAVASCFACDDLYINTLVTEVE